MARVGGVLPGRCGEAWAGGWAAWSSAARGGWGDWGDWMLRAGAGRRELGGGEGGAISRQPEIPRGDSGWREIAWAGFFGGLARKVGAVRGRLGTARGTLGARAWRGVGVGASRAEEAGLKPVHYERWGTSGGGAGA